MSLGYLFTFLVHFEMGYLLAFIIAIVYNSAKKSFNCMEDESSANNKM